MRVAKGGGGGGGYRSHFTKNNTALSHFTKNITLAFNTSWKINENALENHCSQQLWKSRFTWEKIAMSHIMLRKKGLSQATKIPFTNLYSVTSWTYVDVCTTLYKPGGLGVVRFLNPVEVIKIA